MRAWHVCFSASAEVIGELMVLCSPPSCGFWGWNLRCLLSMAAGTPTLDELIRFIAVVFL